MQRVVSLSFVGTLSSQLEGLHCRLRIMKPAHVGVLLLALQSVKGADLSTSVVNNIIQNESPFTSAVNLSYQGFRRFKRGSQCSPGQFMPETSTKCCNKCQAGNYLKKPCDITLNSYCAPCEKNLYMDAENALYSCFRCKTCQEGNGQTIETECSITQNTKCSCMEKYFCETGHCNKCLRCKICKNETEEIVHPCTATSNTVCKEKESNQPLIALVVIPIIVVVLALFGILYWKKETLPCKRKPKSNSNKEGIPFLVIKQPTPEEPVVKDIELSETTLELIVREIEPKNYHQLGIQLGLTEPILQQIEADYHNATNRQGYYILYSWLQNYGTKGAFPRLIEVLRNAGYFTAAENIMKSLNATEQTSIEIT